MMRIGKSDGKLQEFNGSRTIGAASAGSAARRSKTWKNQCARRRISKFVGSRPQPSAEAGTHI
jgi:hypothetical protein